MDAVEFIKKREGAGNPIVGFSRETGHPCSTKNCSLAALEGLVTLNAAVWNAEFAAPEHDPGTDLQLLQADYRNTIYLQKSNRMISFSYDQPIAFTEASVKSSLRCLKNRSCLTLKQIESMLYKRLARVNRRLSIQVLRLTLLVGNLDNNKEASRGRFLKNTDAMAQTVV